MAWVPTHCHRIGRFCFSGRRMPLWRRDCQRKFAQIYLQIYLGPGFLFTEVIATGFSP